MVGAAACIVLCVLGIMAFAPSQASGAPIVPGRWFDRVIIFMFENHAYDEVIKNPDFEKYAKQGTLLLLFTPNLIILCY